MCSVGTTFVAAGKRRVFLNAGLPEGVPDSALPRTVCPKCGHGYAELLRAPAGTLCSECRLQRVMRRAGILSPESAGPRPDPADARKNLGFRWERVRRMVCVPH